MKVLIAPYAAKLFNGQTSPKQYPYWDTLVRLLKRDGYSVIQIGRSGEDRIPLVDEFLVDLSLKQIAEAVKDCALWMSVDSFLPHMVHAEKLNKRGIVLFGPSDPKIFGYPENINLLRGRDFLRPFQFQSWEAWQHNPQAFVYAENVMQHVYKLASPPLVQKVSLTRPVYA